MNRFNPADIEKKWQQVWDETQVYKADLSSDKPKYIAMSMFNYPSGNLHIGHAMNFTISDVMARYKRQQGYESYHPVGWDSFGLPAENRAIKEGISPQESMAQLIPAYRKAYKALGWSNDWSKEISTHEPSYYKWTQWIFSQMYKQDLAYQDSRMQWWCTKCQTVLSNEQVLDGKCWRHDAADDPQVEKKEVKQWFFKITAYADELLEATDALDWSDVVKTAQKNWIGRSVGAEVTFRISNFEFQDSLKFTPELTEMILQGKKTSTIRLEEKQLAVGDKAQFLTRDGERVNEFGSAEITQIRKMSLRDIPNDLEGHEPLLNDEDKLTRYQGYYGDDISLDTEFVVYDFDFIRTSNIEHRDSNITVFTTRPDTLFGATFLVVAPEHELISKLTTEENAESVNDYVKNSLKKTEIERQSEGKDKTGVFTGSYAVNPMNNEKMPIWVADYVLGGYGTGAIMAVPAHDERDNEFAKKFNLPVIEVIPSLDEELFTGDGVLKNSGQFDGVDSAEARDLIIQHLEREGVGKAKTTYKIRDWSVSRQRYWGAPIPIVNCEKCGPTLVPNEQLPVVLPELDDYAPSGDGRSALARATSWLKADCPNCGGVAERETDTLDTYICSSWYQLRYFDPTNEAQAFDPAVVNKWMPIDFYNGGDHATAHLIYVRFMARFFHTLGLLEDPEPFKKFLFNGKVTASDGTMFSKSKGNGIDPLEIINQGYGADALRTYLVFAAPLDQWARWDSQGVPATHRFLSRMWNLVGEYNEAEPIKGANDAVLRAIHPTIKKVTHDLEQQKYNTAIAAMMKCVNDLYLLKTKGFEGGDSWQFALESLVALVGPFAPHTSEELWHQLGHDTSVNKDSWPEWDEVYLISDTMTLAVQVNGKVRAEIEAARDAAKADIEQLALDNDKIKEFLADKKPARVIYVPGRLVNIVI